MDKKKLEIERLKQEIDDFFAKKPTLSEKLFILKLDMIHWFYIHFPGVYNWWKDNYNLYKSRFLLACINLYPVGYSENYGGEYTWIFRYPKEALKGFVVFERKKRWLCGWWYGIDDLIEEINKSNKEKGYDFLVKPIQWFNKIDEQYFNNNIRKNKMGVVQEPLEEVVKKETELPLETIEEVVEEITGE